MTIEDFPIVEKLNAHSEILYRLRKLREETGLEIKCVEIFPEKYGHEVDKYYKYYFAVYFIGRLPSTTVIAELLQKI